MQQSDLPFCQLKGKNSQLWNKCTFDVMVVFLEITVLTAGGLCFLGIPKYSAIVNRGAHNIGDLGKQRDPHLVWELGHNDTRHNLPVWYFHPVPHLQKLFWLLEALSHGLFYYAVVVGTTLMQQSINKMVYLVSQSKLIADPRRESGISESTLPAL